MYIDSCESQINSQTQKKESTHPRHCYSGKHFLKSKLHSKNYSWRHLLYYKQRNKTTGNQEVGEETHTQG